MAHIFVILLNKQHSAFSPDPNKGKKNHIELCFPIKSFQMIRLNLVGEHMAVLLYV